MAKPKSRLESAAIAGMLGVTPGPAGPGAGGASEERAAQPERAEGAHPVRDRTESGIARAENTLVLDPHRIVRRGRYVRPFTDDRRFRDLVTAIEEAGKAIHVPVLVRLEGAPGAVEYVLVDGTHRLEAAMRLGIPVPAVNLGRITPERAFAIQVMANEVRASMHVIDQAAYVLTLLGQGLTRTTVQRTTGFSAGRVSELAQLAPLLASLSDEERMRARGAARVTHRALRALKATAAGDAFRRGVLVLVEQSEAESVLDADGYEIEDESVDMESVADSVKRHVDLVSERDKKGRAARPGAKPGRSPTDAGGVRFVAGRNVRGTSLTFRMAWRARGVRKNPELFMERVQAALQTIALEAAAQYELATASGSRRTRRSRSNADAGGAVETWREVIARDEADLGVPIAPRRAADRRSSDASMQHDSGGIPDSENPIPVPPSQRKPGDSSAGVNPRLLAGLSLPMLVERLKRRPRDYQELDSHVTDVERQAEEARRRARETLEAQTAERDSGGGAGSGGPRATHRNRPPDR